MVESEEVVSAAPKRFEKAEWRQTAEGVAVVTQRIDRLELMEFWHEDDPEARVKASFPFFAGTGNKSTAVVYFEIEPGCRLGTHTDSAEEILLCLEGAAEVFVGEERGRLSAGEMAVVPAMAPHGARNTGDETVRVVGFFSSNVVTAVFDQPMMPFGQRVIGTPPIMAEDEAPAGNTNI